MISGAGNPPKLFQLFGLFEKVKQFQKLKIMIRRHIKIHSNVVSSYEGTATFYLAFNPVQTGGGSLRTPKGFCS